MSTERGGEEPTTSLGGRTLEGLGWNLVGFGGQVVMRVGVLMVLARLIGPEGFGIVAAALVVVNLSILLAEVGLGPALVQIAELGREHIRVALTSLLLMSVGVWAAVATWSGPIASFLGVAQLAAVLPVIGSVFVIRNLTVADWLLQRELDFRRLAVVDVLAYAAGYGLVAVSLALAGAGVWAIVWGHVGMNVVRSILLWGIRPHDARPSLAWGPLRELLGFGAGHMLSRVAYYGAAQADNFVVARWLGASALGLYSRAYEFMVLPSALFSKVVTRVLFPAMAAIQEDRERLQRAFLTATAVGATGTITVTVLALAVSRELILVVLGPDWVALEGAFRVIVAGVVLRTGTMYSYALAKATGAVYRRAWRDGLFAAMVFAGAVVGSRWGIVGVACAVLGALAVNFLLMAGLSIRLAGIGWQQLALAHRPGVLVAALAGVTIAPVTALLRGLGAPALMVLGAGVGAAGATVVAAYRLAPVVPWLRDLAEVLQRVSDSSRRTALAAAADRILGPRYRRSTSPRTPAGAAPGGFDSGGV